MSYFSTKCVAAALAVAAVGMTGAASAQQFRDAGSKIRGDYGFAYQSGSRSLYHARDYANDYRDYVQDTAQNDQPVNPEVAQQHAEGLGQNIDQFQKHLATMRDNAAGDKETLASLDVIDQHVQTAAKHQAKMAAHAEQPEVDAEGSLKCCEDASKSLDKAIAEHDKLMKKLAAKQPATQE